ncbi:MFS transporter [Pararhodobacter zhoushanensis]|uniref:MFS transporter n=1 Tax=Pararhodobacter zhoushanensis TaxID=2479545 RepID=A0ABT3GVF1_9RHOB|nr:MFS transporter [Pararhodobacter zhoushanensis]MCW1931470.1 MFS transporter [Pararhodobacter zhoushanensis]
MNLWRSLRPRNEIWGWWWFDWASQPYNTLLITFIFGPYVVGIVGDGSRAQAIWGYGIGFAGILLALLAPLLGAIADKSGRRMGFIWFFSILYVIGAWGVWFSAPDSFNIWQVMLFFCIGLVGMEFATIFTNAMLPDLAPREELGKVSGSGWAWGYVGGLISLILMLTLLAEGDTGKTLIGIDPLFGLDAAAREGTRSVGPLTAIWYIVFMIPFFLWVREPKKPGAVSIGAAISGAWPELKATLASLPKNRSLFAFLGSSMLYRDALNGVYTFGGIYAAGVLGWSVVSVGIFGILAATTGAVFAWLGGKADSRWGPKPVILFNVIVLAVVALAIVFVSRTSVFGVAVGPESNLPDISFYILGAIIGAGGGSLQSASRTMMVRQGDEEKMTEGFGLYALSGKATAFLAPLSIGIVTDITGSQQYGILPVAALFCIGLILLLFVNPEGSKRVLA